VPIYSPRAARQSLRPLYSRLTDWQDEFPIFINAQGRGPYAACDGAACFCTLIRPRPITANRQPVNVLAANSRFSGVGDPRVETWRTGAVMDRLGLR
jgi:hypothetical protein